MPERQTDLADGTWAPNFVPVDTAGNPLSTIGGGAITVADGSDIALGATADAVVAAGAVGTVSAKLRRVTQGLEDLKTLIVVAALGAVADAAILTNTTGSISGKLRGLVALLRKGAASAPASVAADDTLTGTVLLATNANRLVAVFSNNDTTNAVWIGTTTALTATNGIRIPPGETFADERSTSAWRVICGTGLTATVGVLEVA
jgi:hypothetical protein